jgi:hypothetical protein
MRQLIASLSVLGILLFGSGFVLSFVNPAFVESVAREVIRIEVEHRVGEKTEDLRGTKLAALAERLSGRNAAEIEELKKRLAADLPQKVAGAVAQMRNMDCECRKAIERGMTGILDGRVSDIGRLNERLSVFIRTKYIEVAEALTREFRIFTGANAFVFALLGLTVLVRKRATLQLALPAAVLVVAATVVAALYLFNQNWLHTVLYGDYVGLWYVAYLGLAIAGLADVVFNRARVTTRVVNRLLDFVGSALQAVPC